MRTDGRRVGGTDTHNEANSLSSQFCKYTKKCRKDSTQETRRSWEDVVKPNLKDAVAVWAGFRAVTGGFRVTGLL
jgi:hypothetical protein